MTQAQLNNTGPAQFGLLLPHETGLPKEVARHLHSSTPPSALLLRRLHPTPVPAGSPGLPSCSESLGVWHELRGKFVDVLQPSETSLPSCPHQPVFRKFDLDKSGTMSSYEMRMALEADRKSTRLNSSH